MTELDQPHHIIYLLLGFFYFYCVNGGKSTKYYLSSRIFKVYRLFDLIFVIRGQYYHFKAILQKKRNIIEFYKNSISNPITG